MHIALTMERMRKELREKCDKIIRCLLERDKGTAREICKFLHKDADCEPRHGGSKYTGILKMCNRLKNEGFLISDTLDEKTKSSRDYDITTHSFSFRLNSNMDYEKFKEIAADYLKTDKREDVIFFVQSRFLPSVIMNEPLQHEIFFEKTIPIMENIGRTPRELIDFYAKILSLSPTGLKKMLFTSLFENTDLTVKFLPLMFRRGIELQGRNSKGLNWVFLGYLICMLYVDLFTYPEIYANNEKRNDVDKIFFFVEQVNRPDQQQMSRPKIAKVFSDFDESR